MWKLQKQEGIDLSKSVEEYDRKTEVEFGKLTEEQRQCFTWLCAVRALPFFAQAKMKVVHKAWQDILWAVFRGIDAAASSDLQEDDDFDVWVLCHEAMKNSDLDGVLFYIFHAISFAVDQNSTAVHAVIRAAEECDADIEHIVFGDLDVLVNGTRSFSHYDYGEKIWGDFQNLLRDLDCEYWLDWYTKLFEKGFVLDDEDRDEIKTRLNVPKEIQAQGAAAVAAYMLDLKAQGSKRLNEARVIILGEKGVGKTCLARRLIDPEAPMTSPEESTGGVDILSWEIPGGADGQSDAVNAYIWDFAGHVVTHAVHRCFLSERCLYIYVYKGRTETDNHPEYWLDQIKTYGGTAPVFVLINKQDDHRPDFPDSDPEKYPSVLGVHTVDISKKGALEAFRGTVMNFLRDNPAWKHLEIPAQDYAVKEMLHARFMDKGVDAITRAEFDEIAGEKGISQEGRDRLLRNLHELGICLRYDKAEMSGYDTMVLNPGWIGKGIYTLVNWGQNNSKHILSDRIAVQALDKEIERYPTDKRKFLFSLMQTYELAFFKDMGTIFVPLLLPQRTPQSVPYELPMQDRLRMQYAASQELPFNTVSRLIVRHHTELRGEKEVWRYGAVLHDTDGKTIALVRENREERTITISAMGPNRTDYITRVRATMDAIFDSYKSTKPELRIEILMPESSDRIMVAEKEIQSHIALGQKLINSNTLEQIALEPTQKEYGIKNYFLNIFIGSRFDKFALYDQSVTDDHSVATTINLYDSTLNLQGDLNSLARTIQAAFPADDEDARELMLAAQELGQVQAMVPKDTGEVPEGIKDEVAKKGLFNTLKNICVDLQDENSSLYKKAVTVKRGIQTVQKIAEQYNNIAQWFGLPQVPKVFLSKKD